jgi:hypothetical protein
LISQGEISQDLSRAILIGDSKMIKMYAVHTASRKLYDRPIEFINPSQSYSIAACWNDSGTVFVVGSENCMFFLQILQNVDVIFVS